METTPTHTPVPALRRSRSIGLKLILIAGLALLMTIPALFVAGFVAERKGRAAEVIREVSAHVGGPQAFLGPTLAIPYTIPPQTPLASATTGIYLVSPAQATATVHTTTEARHRSLYKVPVFRADLELVGTFNLSGVPASAPAGAELDWKHAEIVVGVRDLRGALSDATLTLNGKSLTLTPANTFQELSISKDSKTRLALLGAPPGDTAAPGARFTATAALKFSGAQRIALLAFGNTTRATIHGDWPDPGFDGGFLPNSSSLSSHSFKATWSVPFIARGVRAEGDRASIVGLGSADFGVSFVELADPYQSVTRSLKYVLLFLGLIFLSYFVFEVTTGKRVHPAQYILVGMVQVVFYLLLLALAERLGFDISFLLAAAATTGLLSVNAGWVFAGTAQAIRAALVFSLMYGLIYCLLRLEDNALLAGSTTGFIALCAVMYFTRGIDWYSSFPTQLEGFQLQSDQSSSERGWL